MGKEFWKELLALLPFYLLHLDLGVSYTFGSALIEHYKETFPEDVKEGDDISVSLLGILDFVGPIFIATLGGFVQLLVGPKRMLIANGVSSIASWLFIVFGSNIIPCLLMNRACVGISMGILWGNVYLPDTVSPKFLASFKMIEFVSMQFGCIFMFLIMMFFKSLISFNWIAAIFLVFPSLGLFGVFFSKESPVFLAKQELKASEEKTRDQDSSWLQDTLKSLKIPICSPSVYKPLLLTASLGAIGNIAGDIYITKFLVQIINPEKSVEMTSILLRNSSSIEGKDPLHTYGREAYISSFIIQCAKLVVVFMMSLLLRMWRVRFLYFSSLIFTVAVLICLGFVSDESMSSVYFSSTSIMYIKTVLLCLHATVTQLGIETFPYLFQDVAYPTAYQAVLKGLTVSIDCISVSGTIFVLKTISYSHSFFVMAAILLLASPMLYMVVPEVKSMGVEMSAEFFVPFQTVFYFILPENKKGSDEVRANAVKNWKTGVRKIHLLLAWPIQKVYKEEETLDFARRYPKITIDEKIASVESTISDENSRKLNLERVDYISNILNQTGYLCQNFNRTRVLVGRGPIQFKGKRGSIFLFSDILLVAKRLLKSTGRRYVGEVCLKLDSATLTLERKVKEISFVEEEVNPSPVVIQFEEESLSIVWEKYIRYFQSTAKDTVEHREKPVEGWMDVVRETLIVEAERAA